jgi:hypothetical protein
MSRFITCKYWGLRAFDTVTINLDRVTQFSPGPNNGTNVYLQDGNMHTLCMSFDEFTNLIKKHNR